MGSDDLAISRLLEDESLTGDITDAPARVLIKWGIGQLKEGKAEPAVRQTLRALARLIARRASLGPGEARQRLEAAGLTTPDEAALAALWTEGAALADAEWAGKLVGAVGLTPTPLPRSPAPPAVERGEEVAAGGREEEVRWWQRLVGRRE